MKGLLVLLVASASALRLPYMQGAMSRRSATELGAIAALSLPSGTALASGGATAGKTTSIPRAKLRYYDRITAAVSAFEALGVAIAKGGDLKAASSSFFSDRDESPFSEFKSAGYLLAVAFKIDSKIPPDKIQQVKDYKKFMKDLDGLKSVMSKGKQSESASAFATARSSLNVLLDGVELPPIGDVRYS